MPIEPSIKTRRIDQDEFRELAYEVMKQVFDIHNNFGRLFDESVYKKAVARLIEEASTEVSVVVRHKTFSKTYFADVIIQNCGLFEFKAVEAINPRHRAQAIHYLLLFDLAHAKLVNVRPERIQHEFVNCHYRLSELRQPLVVEDNWDSQLGRVDLQKIVMGLIRDWGTGLDVSLYMEAVTHFLGGEIVVQRLIPVCDETRYFANQRVDLVAPEVAFQITTHQEPDPAYRKQLSKFLQHTRLKAVHWINIANDKVTFTTIRA